LLLFFSSFFFYHLVVNKDYHTRFQWNLFRENAKYMGNIVYFGIRSSSIS